MDNFSIEANKLVRRTPVDHLIYRNDLVITKEEFLACYDAWVRNAEASSKEVCPYCSEEQYLKYSKGTGIEIMNGNVLRAFGTDTEIVQPINFCPMCGKKLS